MPIAKIITILLKSIRNSENNSSILYQFYDCIIIRASQGCFKKFERYVCALLSYSKLKYNTETFGSAFDSLKRCLVIAS